MSDNRMGFRGYVFSRPFGGGQRAPQHVQNLVIRDFCRRHEKLYLLSATEYAMPGSQMMLEQVLDEIETLEGVVFYSMFMLPEKLDRRQALYDRVIAADARLAFAVENMIVSERKDTERIEAILALESLTRQIRNENLDVLQESW